MAAFDDLLIHIRDYPGLLLVILKLIKQEASLYQQIVGYNISVVTVLQYFVVHPILQLGQVIAGALHLRTVVFLLLTQ